MKCFVIRMDFEAEMSMFYSWSRTTSLEGVFRVPLPRDEWVPRRDIRFEHGSVRSYGALLRGGRLTEATKHELAKLHCVVQSQSGTARETIDSYSINMDKIPLVNGRLKSALEDRFAGVFDFAPVNQVWNEVHDCPLPGGPYYMANLLARIDSWDKEKSVIHSVTRKNGTSFNSTNTSKSALLESALEDASIWRDTVTGDVLCTEDFRDFVTEAGCAGWSFREISVTPIE
ncbi:imm11 family protein [Cribrihabitans neustonicus]|uniref:imm11 family protein n=1 Tax=Cribrihabitans neustonicus TaxID=1429085 RepID=UPI003B5AD116